MPPLALGRVMKHVLINRYMDGVGFRHWHGELLLHVHGVWFLHYVRYLRKILCINVRLLSIKQQKFRPFYDSRSRIIQ